MVASCSHSFRFFPLLDSFDFFHLSRPYFLPSEPLASRIQFFVDGVSILWLRRALLVFLFLFCFVGIDVDNVGVVLVVLLRLF